VPQAVNGNQLQVNHPSVLSTYTINVFYKNISDLSGIEYFTSLRYLDCGINQLTHFDSLPKTLVHLECEFNHLTSLPELPPALQELICYANNLPILPSLPAGLTKLDCQGNLLDSLPALPNALIILECSQNQLVFLPPVLPASLSLISCSSNLLTVLPPLPVGLMNLFCEHNQLSSIALNASLGSLMCGYNMLSSLPALPSSLAQLSCQNNALTALPALPNGLVSLNCANNQITCFPLFPNTIYPNTSTSLFNFVISANPFNCLPNYIAAMDSATLAYPLCAAGNSGGCPVATGIEGMETPAVGGFPNPANDRYFISIPYPTKINISDELGHLVQAFTVEDSRKEAVVNTSQLPDGVYFVRVLAQNSVYTQKLVVQH
jgi:Leucine-rich repeat (LRR) protein